MLGSKATLCGPFSTRGPSVIENDKRIGAVSIRSVNGDGNRACLEPAKKVFDGDIDSDNFLLEIRNIDLVGQRLWLCENCKTQDAEDKCKCQSVKEILHHYLFGHFGLKSSDAEFMQ